MKGISILGCGLAIISLLGTAGFGQELSESSGSTILQSLNASDVMSLQSLSDEQMTNLVNALDATPTVSFDSLPREGLGGTYYSLQHPEWPPLPADTSSSPVWQMDGFYLLDDLNYDYFPAPAQSLSTNGRMGAMDLSGPPSLDDFGDDTNSPEGSEFIIPDYGTNLWIAQWSQASNTVTGIASNTLADVQYEIQSATNLTQTNWTSQGFIWGSELTNWTALNNLSISLTNNLFIRLRSWYSSDGSGLPDWWELEYFGHLGVDPNADPEGDGWSNIQKFQNGMNPNQFYTPAAPQGVAMTINGTNLIGTVRWSPASGNVTNYVITLSWDYGEVITNYNVSPSATNFNVDVSPYQQIAQEDSWPDMEVVATVQAQYAGGNSGVSAVGGPKNFFITASLASDNQGNPYFAVASVPPGTTAIRMYRFDNYADGIEGDYSLDTNFDVSIAGITNGLVPIPAYVLSTPLDVYGFAVYEWFVQPVNASGGATALSDDFGYTEGTNGLNSWLIQPFYDGRIEAKQNLIFNLRAANNTQFYFTEFNGIYQVGAVTNPPNYAYSGFYGESAYSTSDPVHGGYTSYTPYVDSTKPFADNYIYANFVYNPDNLASNGRLTNGLEGSYNPGMFSSNGDLLLTFPPVYQLQLPITSSTPALLATNETRWLASYPLDSDPTYLGVIGVVYYQSGAFNHYSLPTGGRNWFGLPFLSAEISSSPTNITTLEAESSVTTPYTEEDYFYPEVAQPQFQTVEYDFWNASTYPDYDYYGTVLADTFPLPGMPGFQPTNTSQVLIVPLSGWPVQIAGYAKLQVANSYYSYVYGYLGQYFDSAYVISNAVVTTNLAGLVSPYGSFLPTQPGQAALVTLPDVDSGERGTGVVNVISLQLDKNHDGKMDLSLDGTDATSQYSPYVFWCNNNYDRWAYDTSDGVDYEDDLEPQEIPQQAQGEQVSDCHYGENFGTRMIPTTRDLEDFSRLWVCGITTNLLAALPSGSTVTLDWGDVGSPNPTNPTIDLFVAADADGGIGYLTNSVIASNQIDWAASPYLGRIGPGTSVQLNNYLGTNWFGNHFIWCGVSNGIGQLNLTIKDGNGIVLAQSAAWIKIKDIKQMYERWTVGDDPLVPPSTNAVLASNDLPTNPIVKPYVYPASTDSSMTYILYVHGWNMTAWDKDRFAEAAYKRLFWQGYQGRFGSFRWPTDNGFNGSLTQLATSLGEKDNYDRSEYQAWQSAQGLLNKLNDLDAEYSGNVYLLAHSMGNVVAGEALRLSGTNQIVKTYIASQAAVSAHTYDTSVTNYSFFDPPLSVTAATPNIYGNWFFGNNGGGAGQVINFYNTNDYALQRSVWQLNQLLKPDQEVPEDDDLWSYEYSGSPSDSPPWNNFSKRYSTLGIINFDIVNVLTNRYEVMAFAAQSWTTALGATPNVHNLADSVYLGQVWLPDAVHPSNPFDEHLYHSAEFRGAYWFQQGYWNELMGPDGFNLQ